MYWLGVFVSTARSERLQICYLKSSPQLSSNTKERLICLSQKEFYSNEIELLNKGKPIPNSSLILSLQPLLDDSGLLCFMGRLQNLNVGIRHPVILSRNSHLAKLLVLQLHHDNHHAGPGTILAKTGKE